MRRRVRILVILAMVLGVAAMPGNGSASPAAAQTCQHQGNGNVTYCGGPLMTTTTTYAIFWLPKLSNGLYTHYESLPSSRDPRRTPSDLSYGSSIEQFLKDVGGTSFYNVLTQYSASPGDQIQNQSTFGGQFNDVVSPYPHAGTQADPLVDADMRAEIAHAQQAAHWTPGPNALFLVFTGYNINFCSDTVTYSVCTWKAKPSTTVACDYHQANGLTLYAPMADGATLSNLPCPVTPVQTHKDPITDTTISWLSNELFEAVIDPQPYTGWADATNAEIGDKCAYTYGTIGPDNNNVTLANGHRYLLQQEWSNLANGCVLTYGNQLIDLGTLSLGNADSQAFGINASGQIVGDSFVIFTFKVNAFLYSNGTMIDLGALPSGTGVSSARAINDSGQIVGGSDVEFNFVHAFLYINGQMSDLGTLPGGNNSYAYGINDLGQIVGSSDTGGANSYAILYNNGQMTNLGTLPGGASSQANSINASGQIAGYSTTANNGPAHAFLYSNGQMTDLGTLPGGTSSGATGINSSGQIVGWSTVANTNLKHAFLYSSGQMTDLGTLPGGTQSGAAGIDDSGQIVGSSSIASGKAHAFLYSKGQLTDIGTLPGGAYSYGAAINASGQIVGRSQTAYGTAHAFLYNPG